MAAAQRWLRIVGCPRWELPNGNALPIRLVERFRRRAMELRQRDHLGEVRPSAAAESTSCLAEQLLPRSITLPFRERPLGLGLQSGGGLSSEFGLVGSMSLGDGVSDQAPRLRVTGCLVLALELCLLTCNQWHSVALSGTQWHSVALIGNQWSSVAISGTQWHSMAISGIQWPSVAISGQQSGARALPAYEPAFGAPARRSIGADQIRQGRAGAAGVARGSMEARAQRR